ncbi:MAG: hypothetical protein AABW63_01655 [Nanoarchaeota archaeon]
MRFENTIEYKGKTCKYVFTDPDPRLNEEIVRNLTWHMVDMFYEKDDMRDIKMEDYRGIIHKGKHTGFGQLQGLAFVVYIETENIDSKFGVMLTKIADPSLN